MVKRRTVQIAGSQNSSWMLSGSRNTTTDPIGVSAIGVYSIPRADSSLLPLLERRAVLDTEREMVQASTELIETVTIAAVIFEYSQNPSRLRIGEHPVLDRLVIAGQQLRHPQQSAVPLGTAISIRHRQRNVMTTSDRRHSALPNEATAGEPYPTNVRREVLPTRNSLVQRCAPVEAWTCELWALRDSNPRPPPCKASEAERCAQPRFRRSALSETRKVRG